MRIYRDKVARRVALQQLGICPANKAIASHLRGKLTMNDTNQSVLTERHIVLFGAIVQWFARYELTMKQAIAGVVGTELSCVAIPMRGLDFAQKRAALLDLLRDRSVPQDRWERVFAYLSVPACHIQLRDAIVHSTWINCTEPRSIQPNWILKRPPSIEPLYLSETPDETRYTLEGLGEIAADLADGHERFLAYLIEAGLIRIQANVAKS